MEVNLYNWAQSRGWEKEQLRKLPGEFPGGPEVKNPPADAGGTGWIPCLRRSHVPRVD